MLTTEVSAVLQTDIAENFDLAVVPLPQLPENETLIPPIASPGLKTALELGDFSGEVKEQIFEYDEESCRKHLARRLLFTGVGRQDDEIPLSEKKESLREAGGVVAGCCKKLKVASVALYLDTDSPVAPVTIRSFLEGLLLGDYQFSGYRRGGMDKGYAGLEKVVLVVSGYKDDIAALVDDVKCSTDAVLLARNMSNEPGSLWTPENFAEYARQLSESENVSCTVLERMQLESLGMGGLLAVNRGSAGEPAMIVVAYRVRPEARTLLLVGKGITFDSGGICLKNSAGMEEMKYDMCGGATVMGVMHWVARMQPQCNVVAVVPATDNMSGSNALKPGDIIYHYNRTSSEIINTDAEGRLLLADALSYGIEKYAPDCVIDLATLTGAIIVGLGHHRTGLFANNDELAAALDSAGRECGEPLWRMPLGKEYAKQIESKVADLKNSGGRDGGAVTAAEYLHAFVGDTPWAHLDIAGTAWSFSEKRYIPGGGASGICVRTLIELIRGYR